MKKIVPLNFMLFFVFGFFSQAQAALEPGGDVVKLIAGLQHQMTAMQKTIESQNQRIETLEGRLASISIPAPAGETRTTGSAPLTTDTAAFDEQLGKSLGGANKWLKNIALKGDMRLRWEAFENHSGNAAETNDRNRFRFRLRTGLEKKFSDEMKIGFAFASGENVNGVQVDPSSTNTSFDNNFNFKDIYIDKAFATYSPSWAKKGPVKSFAVTAGKMENPFELGSKEIVWDKDVRPEGVSEKIDVVLIHSEAFKSDAYLTLGQFVLDEDAAGDDAELFAHQIGTLNQISTPLFEKPVEFQSSASYYSYLDYAQGSNFTIGGTSLARGNPNVTGLATELDTGDFEVLDFYHEVTVRPHGLPVSTFFEWVENLDNAVDRSSFGSIGNEENKAWSFGGKIGNAAKRGDWELGYAYRRIEANAVPGFNDADFGAAGHSGKRGSILKASYGITDYLTLNLMGQFVNNLDTDTEGILDEEQKRFQTDLVWKF